MFQGVVIKRHRAGARSTFTVRKVSFNVGVERIFLSHSPRIEKRRDREQGRVVRRARLFYLRDLAGKAARVPRSKRRLKGARLFADTFATVVGGRRRTGVRLLAPLAVSLGLGENPHPFPGMVFAGFLGRFSRGGSC